MTDDAPGDVLAKAPPAGMIVRVEEPVAAGGPFRTNAHRVVVVEAGAPVPPQIRAPVGIAGIMLAGAAVAVGEIAMALGLGAAIVAGVLAGRRRQPPERVLAIDESHLLLVDGRTVALADVRRIDLERDARDPSVMVERLIADTIQGRVVVAELADTAHADHLHALVTDAHRAFRRRPR